MAKKTVTIRVKRSADKTLQELSSEKLGFGEPLYVEKEDCLLVGKSNSSASISNQKVFKAIDKDVADGLGVKWLSQWSLNVPNYIAAGKAYEINADGSLNKSNPTTTTPLGIEIRPETADTSKLRDIRDGMMPQLSLHIPDAYRNQPTQVKTMQKNFATISDGEVKDGYIILYFTTKKPNAAFTINLIGG